jgi:uncharacterized protein YdiU (UPF0061 family)
VSVLPAPTVRLDDRFARELPELAVAWEAAPAPEPRLLALNDPLALDLGLDPAWLRSEDGLRFLVGTNVLPGERPVAQAYAGHQFGGFNPRLGDGRALLLGELTAADGARRDLHLKGSGRTPFARGGDGLATVGPMLREHVVSEAMHALGIPTTRSLAVVATGRGVRRETVLPGAVLARVASSHLRVGSFQYARATGDAGLLRRLVDHAIARHHPAAADAETPALALFQAVVAAQAALVARWMLVGFVHGVMNTDNTTISGETIDYGPCAFLDAYDPATVFSSIDEGGRYAYGNQPVVMEWNLARLVEALLPLLDDDEEQAIAVAVEAARCVPAAVLRRLDRGMRDKLGCRPPSTTAEVASLAEGSWRCCRPTASTSRRSSGASARPRAATPSRPAGCSSTSPGSTAWVARWRALGPDAALCDRSNPVYVPRNHLVEEALSAAVDG